MRHRQSLKRERPQSVMLWGLEGTSNEGGQAQRGAGARRLGAAGSSGTGGRLLAWGTTAVCLAAVAQGFVVPNAARWQPASRAGAGSLIPRRAGMLSQLDFKPAVDVYAKFPEQHAPKKFTYAGLKQYLRLALFYTASFLHGTGCIALDGVFEDLATAEKARSNVWQWLAFDQPLLMPDGTTTVASPALLEQAMEEVYATALGAERETWGRVCKSVPPMQPDTLGEQHFRVARKILTILCASDRPLEFIPDLAYPFLLEPVRQDAGLWEELYQHLDTYMDPMVRYAAPAAVKASQD